jgi:hypothetical protein
MKVFRSFLTSFEKEVEHFETAGRTIVVRNYNERNLRFA